ncbi:hypothetical protein [Candidatus Pelagibacter sp. HIMB1506]|uniref:hypothetical protein n=1 Tax=Candidatus Pelagibacter sp. HIMB1506 TaxID=3413337 RepID=UPI003F84C090
MINSLFLQSLLIFFINISVFYLVNKFILKKNFLIDLKKKNSHKKLINLDEVPISGGVVIFLNLLFFNYFSLVNYILISLIFLIGLLADIQRLNSPTKRLIFQCVLIVIFIFLNELFLRSIRLPVFDFYLNNDLFSLIFTSFCMLILINGSNFIDGSNFQCSGFYLTISIILMLLNSKVVAVDDINLIYILFPVLLSFVFYNFLNKSYLGDGGSYLVSLVIGYTLINFQIIENVSPYLVVLFLWYPAFENLFSILRRVFSKNSRPDKADLMHLHHLIFQYFNNNYKFNNYLKFSISGLIINSFNLFVFYIGSFFLYSTVKLIFLIFFCIFVYLISYYLLLKKLKLQSD